ncbi:MAG: type II toxin-antitoxin system HicA family toxin [Candidatus Yonathbacteria bacterium]|nr:type II toxin-antitoxin system HicA family toxin [Candidatus Yonathbacteria bacterium]
MPKNISHRELVKKFRALGFEGPYSGGKHLFMIQGEFKLRIPNPHKGDISKSLLSEILRQADISPKEWDAH